MASQKLLNGLFVIPTEERDLNNISINREYVTQKALLRFNQFRHFLRKV